MSVTITPLAPDDETGLRAWFAIEEAAQPVDRPDDVPPVWASHRARLSAPRPGVATSAWLAHRDGTTVGAAVLELPVRDNLETAVVEIVVHPAHRRAGVGSTLLELLTGAARRAGRVRLIGEARSPLSPADARSTLRAGAVPMVRSPLYAASPGTAFATAARAKDAQVDVQRRLDLAAVDAPAGVRLEAASAGWPLVRWSGATPEKWLDDIARLQARMSTDAPLGDLTWTPEVHDAARVRERDAMCAARGITVLTTAAVAPDGHLGAYTEIGLDAATEHRAHTWNTLVLPEHRGKGLGLRVKLANLAHLREVRPSVRQVTTWNAASNTHMIRINEALGFRPVDALHEFQLEL